MLVGSRIFVADSSILHCIFCHAFIALVVSSWERSLLVALIRSSVLVYVTLSFSFKPLEKVNVKIFTRIERAHFRSLVGIDEFSK